MKDTDIEVLGSKPKPDNSGKKRTLLLVGILFLIAAIVVVLIMLLMQNQNPPENQSEDNSEQMVPTAAETPLDTTKPHEIIVDTVIFDSIEFRVFKPINLRCILSTTTPDTNDSKVMFVTQAANIRDKSYEIIGDFVEGGDHKFKESSGNIATLGYCAIIGNKITIDKAKTTAKLKEAIDSNGYFFRQFPLVYGEGEIEKYAGEEGVSQRRAFCLRQDTMLVVESISRITMGDFARMLNKNFDVDHAINLIGSFRLTEWYRTSDTTTTTLFTNKSLNIPNCNYLIFRAK